MAKKNASKKPKIDVRFTLENGKVFARNLTNDKKSGMLAGSNQIFGEAVFYLQPKEKKEICRLS